MAASRTFLQSASDTANVSEYTFSSQNLGAASSDRYIVACCATRAIGATLAITGVTIQGTSATLAVNAANNATNSCAACLAIAAIPTGTTGDVVVTLNTTALRCAIVLYAVTGINSATAHDTDSNAKGTGTDGPDGIIDVPSDGVAISAVISGWAAPDGGFNWAGLTEDSDFWVEANTTVSTASGEFSTLQTGLAVNTTATAANQTDQIGVFASWAPASGGGGFQSAWARGSNVLIGV